MNQASADPTSPSGSFSEREFYLAEFRGRSLALAVADPEADDPAALDAVLDILDANETRVLLLAANDAVFARHRVDAVVDVHEVGWIGALWRASRERRRVGLRFDREGELAAACGRAAVRLRVAKLVWIGQRSRLEVDEGRTLSFVDRRELGELLAEPPIGWDSRLVSLLRAIARMIDDGLPSVAITRAAELADELFTFSGSGTLFARERYVEVRWLGLDEFASASDLVQRGVEEGYLVERSAEELELVLSSAFGVFVEGRYLAGIGALLAHETHAAGEIASLYTLTRFVGEGVGGHLIRFALERATAAGYGFVFACTTSERVEDFFHRNGFETVSPDGIPPEKWKGYSQERMARVRCLRRDLG